MYPTNETNSNNSRFQLVVTSGIDGSQYWFNAQFADVIDVFDFMRHFNYGRQKLIDTKTGEVLVIKNRDEVIYNAFTF